VLVYLGQFPDFRNRFQMQLEAAWRRRILANRRAFTLVELPFDRLGSTELAEVKVVSKRKRVAFTLVEC